MKWSEQQSTAFSLFWQLRESLETSMEGGNVEMKVVHRGDVCSPFSDPGLTLACHGVAALCVMPLHADFGVEIAGTMWIVLSVFKDQNNNATRSAHSLTLIDHLSCLSLAL